MLGSVIRLPPWWWLPSFRQRKLHLQPMQSLLPCSVGQGGYRARPGSGNEDTGLRLTEGHSTDRMVMGNTDLWLDQETVSLSNDSGQIDC